MIDTIAFKIPYSTELEQKITSKNHKVTICYDNILNEQTYHYSKCNHEFGSYEREINLFVSDKNIRIEFSVPKFKFGHNIYMIFPDELQFILYRMELELNRVYETKFPSFILWKLLRIDLCYNWKFPTQEVSEIILSFLKKYSYPRKFKKFIFPSSIMYVGKKHSLKFYLKYPEFYKHDFRFFLKKNQTDLAYNLLQKSCGVLRFEVSLKSSYLKNMNYITFSNQNFVCKILNEFIQNTIKTINTNYMNLDEAKILLSNKYKNPFTVHNLLRFWVCENLLEKEIFDTLYDIDRSNIYRNRKKLKEAGVGIYKNFLLQQYDDLNLSVPSDLATNFPYPRQDAVASGDNYQIRRV